MSNETKTIHDFDFDLICEHFLGVERQGPGSPAMTLRALSFIDSLGPRSRIADLGCGTGGQTMVLGQHTDVQITGLDLFPQFIDRFNEQAAGLGLSDRVRGIAGSMDRLPFDEQSLDVIWSEGAIYNIGYERGMREWRRYLKPGGYVAVTEASWFTGERPAEIQKFWDDSYAQIDTIPVKIAQMQRAGYEFIAAFSLPDSCWTEDFYGPMPQAQEAFLKKHPGNPAAQSLVDSQRHERALYDKYKAYYGYTFYIGRKV